MSPAFLSADWAGRNRALLAKTIREFAYEEALAPVADETPGWWRLALAAGVTYRFQAVRGIWSSLAIDPASLTRDGVLADDLLTFLLDARQEFAAAPDALAGYGRELLNTLLADGAVAAANAGLTAETLAGFDGDSLQAHLDGHPKAPGNKGRLGWGLADLQRYAPEFHPRFSLMWVAAHKSRCRWAFGAGVTAESLLAHSLSPNDQARYAALLQKKGLAADEYLPLPVHPWQWQAMIVSAFGGDIASGHLVPLGSFGDAYQPLQSLRTLANVARPEAMHLKLPLTILNTSAWRGIPGKYLSVGPLISAWLKQTVAQDAELAAPRRVIIQGEPAGIFYPHPFYEALPDAPYQYREMLGAIWRESPVPALADGEAVIMLGALWQKAGDGRSLVSAWIAQSGLSPEAWLTALFEAVTVPLYHFLARYGVGFIAHGQNISVILRNGVPVGVTLKDFQGDLDLVEDEFPELESLDAAARAALPRKPALYVAHGLLTGHFVTTLRFLSETLRDEALMDEQRFYGLLAGVLRRYQARHPELTARFALFDVFAPNLHRVCINRVRLAIGYSDAAQRPVPIVGSPLENPLWIGERAGLSTLPPSVSAPALEGVA